jgi:hypothetical protein
VRPAEAGLHGEIHTDAEPVDGVDEVVVEEAGAAPEPGGRLAEATGVGVHRRLDAADHPLAIGEIVDPEAAVVRPAQRMHVHAEHVAVIRERLHHVGERVDRMRSVTVQRGDLRIHPQIPTEHGSVPRDVGQAATETLGDLDPRAVSPPRGAVALKPVGLDVEAQKGGDRALHVTTSPARLVDSAPPSHGRPDDEDRVTRRGR